MFLKYDSHAQQSYIYLIKKYSKNSSIVKCDYLKIKCNPVMQSNHLSSFTFTKVSLSLQMLKVRIKVFTM